MYTELNIKEFYVLPKRYIYVSYRAPKKTSDYFAIELWLVLIPETECVYCAVRTESLNKL